MVNKSQEKSVNPNERIWEIEYNNPQLVSLSMEPQSSLKEFLRTLRRTYKKDLAEMRVLDLGTGVGKNAIYLAELGVKEVTGIDISAKAIEIAKDRFAKVSKAIPSEVTKNVKFLVGSIGKRFPCEDASVELILDVTSSNSLSENEREIYLNECARVLTKDGLMFIRALCKDGDSNAQHLLKAFPGKEKDTYIMPQTSITERVWSKADFIEFYSKFFEVEYLDKETHYTTISDNNKNGESRKYKRNFWIGYLKKK